MSILNGYWLWLFFKFIEFRFHRSNFHLTLVLDLFQLYLQLIGCRGLLFELLTLIQQSLEL